MERVLRQGQRGDEAEMERGCGRDREEMRKRWRGVVRVMGGRGGERNDWLRSGMSRGRAKTVGKTWTQWRGRMGGRGGRRNGGRDGGMEGTE